MKRIGDFETNFRTISKRGNHKSVIKMIYGKWGKYDFLLVYRLQHINLKFFTHFPFIGAFLCHCHESSLELFFLPSHTIYVSLLLLKFSMENGMGSNTTWVVELCFFLDQHNRPSWNFVRVSVQLYVVLHHLPETNFNRWKLCRKHPISSNSFRYKFRRRENFNWLRIMFLIWTLLDLINLLPLLNHQMN